MKPRPDLLCERSPPGLEVFQLTTEPAVPCSHIYMEAQIFTPDSRRLVLRRAGNAHGGAYGTEWTSGLKDPDHHFLVCDLENGGELSPIVTEKGAKAPAVSPDGTHLYYFVDETSPGKGRLILKRVHLDGTGRETVFTLDTDIPGTRFHASRPYVLSTISSDGRRVALPVFLGDGNTDRAPFGLLCFDVEQAAVSLVFHGPTFRNQHPQYCRSPDPVASHDILIQEDHGCIINAAGLLTGYENDVDDGDIHVIRDDGSRLRDMPWGRDGNEFVQGHQCWRGRGQRAITSTTTLHPKEFQLIEGEAAPHAGHIGRNTPGGTRNDLSRSYLNPYFFHFGVDIEGRRLISDTGPGEGALVLAGLPDDAHGALVRPRYLLSTGSSWRTDAHIHPFLSPDGSMGFFNSDETGVLQAYLVRGW